MILKRPFSVASQATVSRWIVQVITHSGPTGTPGSVRSAASSRASFKGASEQTILKAGEWTRLSTFQRFYNKIDPEFADLVLAQ